MRWNTYFIKLIHILNVFKTHFGICQFGNYIYLYSRGRISISLSSLNKTEFPRFYSFHQIAIPNFVGRQLHVKNEVNTPSRAVINIRLCTSNTFSAARMCIVCVSGIPPEQYLRVSNYAKKNKPRMRISCQRLVTRAGCIAEMKNATDPTKIV